MKWIKAADNVLESGESHVSCALTNVCSVLAGENGAQLQVWKNIKTQLRADMELVMQKSEDRGRRRSGARGRRRSTQQREMTSYPDVREADTETERQHSFIGYD